MNLYAIMTMPVSASVRVGMLRRRIMQLQRRIREDADMLSLRDGLDQRLKHAGPAEAQRIRLAVGYISACVTDMANNMDAVKKLTSEWRAARKEMDKLYEERSWLLTEGELKGAWVQCANAHDNYSDRPDTEPDWRKEPLLGRGFWLCSAKCAQEWRAKQTAKMDREHSQRVEITMEGGKKHVLTTSGRTHDGTHTTPFVSRTHDGTHTTPFVSGI